MAKINYRCTSCKWKFSRTTEPTHCPYCGKPTVDIDKTQAVEDILREITE